MNPREAACVLTGITGGRLRADITAAPPPNSCLHEPCSSIGSQSYRTDGQNQYTEETHWGACALTSCSTLFSNICNLYYLGDRQQLSELSSLWTGKRCLLCQICSCLELITIVSVLWRSRKENAKCIIHLPCNSLRTYENWVPLKLTYGVCIPDVTPCLSSDRNRSVVAGNLNEDCVRFCAHIDHNSRNVCRIEDVRGIMKHILYPEHIIKSKGK